MTKMRLFATAAAAGLVLLICTCAGLPPGSGAGEPSSVWAVQNGGNTVYIGGSMHALRPEDYPMPAPFMQAFKKAKTLVIEADIDIVESPEFLARLSEEMHLPEGITLQSLLDKEAWALIEERSGGEMQLKYINTLKPGIVINILGIEAVTAAGFTADGVDVYFLNLAKQKKLALNYLESAEFQLQLLCNMGEGFENDYVKSSLSADIDEEVKSLWELQDAWRHGKVEPLLKMIEEEQNEFPSVYEALIKSRNDSWMPRLREYLNTAQTEFVIVGLLHLYGEDGIITQLKNEGFIVTQVK